MESDYCRKQYKRRWISAFRQAKLAQSADNNAVLHHDSNSSCDEEPDDILRNVTTVTDVESEAGEVDKSSGCDEESEVVILRNVTSVTDAESEAGKVDKSNGCDEESEVVILRNVTTVTDVESEAGTGKVDKSQICFSETELMTDNDVLFDRTEYPFSSSDTDSDFNDTMLCDDLAAWVSEFGIKFNAVDKLLHILQKSGHKVPSTCSTLMKTEKHVLISEKSGMQYVFLGVANQLKKFLQLLPEELLNSLTELEISLNIDGLPLFKSSATCIWPVLCAVVSLKPVTVFPVAVTCGRTKPCNLDFLEDTVNELNDVLKCGLIVNNHALKVHLRCIVCDAPARAMVKAVKLYSGYEGCDKCTQHGQYIGRMTYQDVETVELRTDNSFRNQFDKEHHHEISPFCKLPIDMVKMFPIDYMHQCCLGAMRKLLIVWLRGKAGKLAFKISAGQAHQISERLIALKKFVPKLFARRPRSLAEVDRWKATELRMFLLYFGKFVLKDVLSQQLYDNFMKLSVGISILVSPSLASVHAADAHELLTTFVLECKEIYGEDFLVYNIHSMIHITSEAQQFGSLDNCSGFIFENYLQRIKKLVRSGRNPLAQIVKRLSEYTLVNHFKPPEDRLISTKPPNNTYVLENFSCCEVIDDLSAAFGNNSKSLFLCRTYEKTRPLFTDPCDSRILGTYIVHRRDSSVVRLEGNKLKTQAVMVEIQDDPGTLCFMAVLHDAESHK